VILASDMADRIRLNRRGGATYQAAGAGTNRGCEPGAAAPCSPTQMAEHDLWAWNAQIDRQLPGADGVVLFTAAAPPIYTIRVTWQEVGLGAITHQIAIRVPDL
jgi:hypothetical protein